MRARFMKTAIALGLGILPLAAYPHGGPGGRSWTGCLQQASPFGGMADRLKLTEDQKTRIQGIQAKHLEASTAKLQAAAAAGDAFRDAMRKPDTPDTQIKTLYQARADKALELVLDRRAMRNEMRAVLTPEQRTEWDRWQAYRQARMAFGKGGRKGQGRY